MMQWYQQLSNKSADYLTESLLIEMAKQKGKDLDLPASFKFLSNWVQRFKKKAYISSNVLYGEISSTNQDGINIS